MRRTLVVPALAAMMAIPTTQALEISDEDASLKFGIRLQSRIEFANAKTADDNDFDIQDGATEDPQSINFYVRRARLYMKGKYKGGWKYELTMFSDDIGDDGSNDASRSGVRVRYATVGKGFGSQVESKHSLTFGLQKAQLLSSHTDSSSRLLFFDARLANLLKTEDRHLGLQYKASGSMFNAYARFSEAGGNSDQNGYQLAFRVETGLTADMHLKKRKESFLGKEGFGHQLGLGLGIKTESKDKSTGDDNGDGSTISPSIIFFTTIRSLPCLTLVSTTLQMQKTVRVMISNVW